MSKGQPEDTPRPVVAVAVGLSSLSTVPLALATVALYLAPESWNESAWRLLRASGAVALSFLGAVHWGWALADRTGDTRRAVAALCWSVVPAALGWLILVLDTAGGPSALVLGVGFSAQFVADRRAHTAGYCPEWYLVIRSRLTIVILACLVAALLVGAHY